MAYSMNSIEKYFEFIQNEIKKAYLVAGKAREKGFDPERRVDVPLASNMAERVAGLISIVSPDMDKNALTKRIHELESTYELLDWRVALKIAEEVVNGKFCSFNNREEAMDIAIRTGFAYLTLGIVAAPLEGFIKLKIKKRGDGKEYLSLYYAGPIRGAGGTASATSVILADYVRTIMGLGVYDPSEDEISRYVTEINDYHERITNLQYRPSEEEIRFLVKHIPVEVNGEPTEKVEVSNYKDLARVETNRIRGGVCLVVAEGLAQKSPKLWKRLSRWGRDFNIDWEFLEKFISLQKSIKAGSFSQTETQLLETHNKITPNYTYIADLVAGRPILSHPMMNGGFRLRYGRTPVSGFSSAGLHPSTLSVLNNFIATGTQLKIERPGKAATVTPCDSIEGPIVKLNDGSVVRVADEKDIKKIVHEISEIVYLGDILISYGDFSENGHKFVPAGYCEEWWVKEVDEAIKTNYGGDIARFSKDCGLESDTIKSYLEDYFYKKPSFNDAFSISQKLNVPLHPRFTYFWKSIGLSYLNKFIEWLKTLRLSTDSGNVVKIILPFSENNKEEKRVLELLAVPHQVINSEFVVVKGDDAKSLYECLNLNNLNLLSEAVDSGSFSSTLEVVNKIAPVKIRDLCGTFIGARMGRPEKAKMRKLSGSPHALFPVGNEGDRLRSFQSALKNKKVTAEFPLFHCSSCNNATIYPSCQECGASTNIFYSCKECGSGREVNCSHGEKKPYKKMELDIGYFFNSALKKLDIAVPPNLIKGVRGTSNEGHVVENLAKGILRAKHDIYVNKDGTTRYDMTELPVTHFHPKEIGTSVERLRDLGYETDINGIKLSDNNQLLELMPQDIILPLNQNSLEESSRKVLYRVSKFIDDLLSKFYGLEEFYRFDGEDDIIGHLVIGLAPHISAGLIGRIIGFSETQACFAHPLWHAGLRRDCDGDEACVMLLMDALLNFSRKFLPNMRGAKTMDSPLVLTSKLIPSEVDDQSHGLDIQWYYPLELYEAALQYKDPWEIRIEQIKHRLGTDLQYGQFGFTHPVSNLNIGVKCSAYKTIPSMAEKMEGQMKIASMIRAVDSNDVARLVIEKHFLKDIRGNLRKFSMQNFRCVQCGEKFRRPPLIGKCNCCGGKIIFTVSEGSVIKYLQLSIYLSKNFNIPSYLSQNIEIVKRMIEGVFGKEKYKQAGLGGWME